MATQRVAVGIGLATGRPPSVKMEPRLRRKRSLVVGRRKPPETPAHEASEPYAPYNPFWPRDGHRHVGEPRHPPPRQAPGSPLDKPKAVQEKHGVPRPVPPAVAYAVATELVVAPPRLRRPRLEAATVPRPPEPRPLLSLVDAEGLRQRLLISQLTLGKRRPSVPRATAVPPACSRVTRALSTVGTGP